ALTVPDASTVEATSASGRSVVFSTSATDAVDPSPVVTCKVGTTAITSPHTFALGTTTVSCTAKDASNNTSDPKTFDVTVQDTTAPALTVPDASTVEATSASGRSVGFSTSATDAVDPSPVVTCTAGTTA